MCFKKPPLQFCINFWCAPVIEVVIPDAWKYENAIVHMVHFYVLITLQQVYIGTFVTYNSVITIPKIWTKDRNVNLGGHWLIQLEKSLSLTLAQALLPPPLMFFNWKMLKFLNPAKSKISRRASLLYCPFEAQLL